MGWEIFIRLPIINLEGKGGEFPGPLMTVEVDGDLQNSKLLVTESLRLIPMLDHIAFLKKF